MATTWTETANEICRDALEHIGAVGAGDTVSAEDYVLALRALDSVLKELPLFGYHWPKLSGEATLTWSVLTPQTVSLPADYYNYPVVWADGVPLGQIPHSTWVAMTDRDAEAEKPTHFYVSPSKTLHFWPIPTQDPVATIQYQKIVDDAVGASAPDVLQFWINPLGYGVADELGLKFDVPQAKRVEIAQRWAAKRDRALENSIAYEPISFTVAD